MLILLSRQDVGNQVIPVKEPLVTKNVQIIKYRGGIGFLNPQWGRVVSARVRRGRRGQLQLLIRKREDGGRIACK
jgi:hypothetical protein